MTTNYKGFNLRYSLDKHSNIIIEEVEGGLTNQIALLTSALWNSYSGANKVKQFTVELDYKVYDNFTKYGCDFAIDIERWIMANPTYQQRVMIELLMEEQTEILEQIGEVV